MEYVFVSSQEMGNETYLVCTPLTKHREMRADRFVVPKKTVSLHATGETTGKPTNVSVAWSDQYFRDGAKTITRHSYKSSASRVSPVLIGFRYNTL